MRSAVRIIQLPPWENDKGKARQRPGWKRQGISTNSERLGKRPLIWNIIPFYQKLTRKNQTFEEKLGLPAKPKKPDTPFFQFRAKVYSEVKEKYPEAGALEIVKKITELWRNLDEKIKSSMVEDYKAQLKSYSHELAKYHYELTDDQRELLKSERQKKLLAKQDRRQKVELKKKLKELGKPKKPPKAFALFLKSKMDKEHQPIKLIKATTKFSKEWQNLDENEKKIYLDEAKQKYEIYKRDLQAWEEKMICLGNIDVVREESLIEPRETGVKSSRKAKSQTVDSHKQKIKSSSDNRSSEIHEEDNR